MKFLVKLFISIMIIWMMLALGTQCYLAYLNLTTQYNKVNKIINFKQK